ncbi:MAG TPA: hypothetical protein VK137_19850, partial [Planctomycetaceae bacterium]|nr:hypothetical protein [Planctomycetaceae bacterium]
MRVWREGRSPVGMLLFGGEESERNLLLCERDKDGLPSCRTARGAAELLFDAEASHDRSTWLRIV